MSLLHRGFSVTALGALLAFPACSSDEGSGSGGAGGSGATGGSAGSSGSAGSAGSAGSSGSGPTCPGPGFHEEYTPVQIAELTARVLDLEGNPAVNIQATVCGTDICIFGNTDGTGTVQSCDENLGVCTPGIQPNQGIRKTAFKFAQGFTHVKWAYLLPPGDTHALGDFTTAKLPDMATGVALVPGTAATSSGVTVTPAPDSAIKIDILTYETDEQKRFRAVEIPVAQANLAVDASKNFEILIGTTPVDTHFCPPAKLSVPNTPAWAAGTEVEFWVHGVDPGEEWAPYGGWAKVSDGVVSSDGQSVETSDGQGVPLLSVFGIRQK